MEKVRIGSIINILNEDGQYSEWEGKYWKVTKISTSTRHHPLYDESIGQVLVDCEDLPVSLYQYEFEVIKY